tara:strand:- start:1024 stop:1341 length:318 start_codon:yes stop_codon:yes gene_type:complete
MFVYGLFDYLLTCVLAFGAGVVSAYLYSTRKPKREVYRIPYTYTVWVGGIPDVEEVDQATAMEVAIEWRDKGYDDVLVKKYPAERLTRLNYDQIDYVPPRRKYRE